MTQIEDPAIQAAEDAWAAHSPSQDTSWNRHWCSCGVWFATLAGYEGHRLRAGVEAAKKVWRQGEELYDGHGKPPADVVQAAKLKLVLDEALGRKHDPNIEKVARGEAVFDKQPTASQREAARMIVERSKDPNRLQPSEYVRRLAGLSIDAKQDADLRCDFDCSICHEGLEDE